MKINVMEVKDLVPIIISLVALSLSVLTIGRERAEERRTIRGQITDIVSNLISAISELDEVREDISSNKNDRYLGKKLDRLKRQINSLAEYVEYLIQERPDLVIAIDYANLALGFETIAAYDKAIIYWKKSIETFGRMKGSLYSLMSKGVSTRRYADLLFKQGQVDEGRDQFREAIILFTIEQDRACWEKGFTYIKWARNEASIQCIEDAERYLIKAEEVYKTIRSEIRKREALDSLKREVKLILQPPSAEEPPP